MIVILFIFLLAVLYYVKFRYSRNFLYAFSKTLPTVGDLPILGHTHWFIGGPESKYKFNLVFHKRTNLGRIQWNV